MDIIQECGRFVESLPLNITEIIICAMLLYGALMGLKNGFLKELASMTGFFIGLFLAWKYYDRVDGTIISFMAIWVATPILLGCVATLLTRLLDWTLVGGVMNRVLGCLFGFTKWAVLFICLLVITNRLSFLDKYIDHNSVPGVNYMEKKWKTLQKSL